MSKASKASKAQSRLNSILLSFDIEEFDIPEEYGQNISEQIKLDVSRQGLEKILNILEKTNVRATFFVTAHFALHHQALIHQISEKHEIASHGFYHSKFQVEDLHKSRLVLGELIGKSITGFRMARLQHVDDSDISQAGYKYNSSMNPTYIPGRYNNFFKPRTAYYSGNLLNIPVSVTPLIRFPLFWLSFKNFPLWFIKLASLFTLRHDRYINLYFHPWEFIDISNFNLPGYIKNKSGKVMVDKLNKYIVWLQRQGQFVCFDELHCRVKIPRTPPYKGGI